MDLGEERVRRAQALMAVAALGLIVAGAVYLKPSMSPPQAAQSAADRVPATASGWRLVSASFADSNHGTVEIYRSGPAPTISFLNIRRRQNLEPGCPQPRERSRPSSLP